MDKLYHLAERVDFTLDRLDGHWVIQVWNKPDKSGFRDTAFMGTSRNLGGLIDEALEAL